MKHPVNTIVYASFTPSQVGIVIGPGRPGPLQNYELEIKWLSGKCKGTTEVTHCFKSFDEHIADLTRKLKKHKKTLADYKALLAAGQIP